MKHLVDLLVKFKTNTLAKMQQELDYVKKHCSVMVLRKALFTVRFYFEVNTQHFLDVCVT